MKKLLVISGLIVFLNFKCAYSGAPDPGRQLWVQWAQDAMQEIAVENKQRAAEIANVARKPYYFSAHEYRAPQPSHFAEIIERAHNALEKVTANVNFALISKFSEEKDQQLRNQTNKLKNDLIITLNNYQANPNQKTEADVLNSINYLLMKHSELISEYMSWVLD